MPFTDSARGVIQDVIADDSEDADYPVQIKAIVDAIEPNLVLKATTVAAANATLTPLIDGMLLLTTQAPKEVYFRDSTSTSPAGWRKVWPTTYKGTAAPAAGLGVDNDVYFQYA